MDKNVQIHEKTNEGTEYNIYPISKAKNIQVDRTKNQNLPANAENVADVVENLGTLAFQDSLTLPPASTETYGLAKLSEDTTDESNTETAATTSAVSKVSSQVNTLNGEVVKNSGDQNVNGMKTFEDGIIIGSAKITSDVDSLGTKVVTLDII